MKFPGLCWYVVQDGGNISDWSGGMIGGMGDKTFKSITDGLAAQNGASVQNRSAGAAQTAALSDQFAGFIGAICSDYKPELSSRMCLEY